MPLDLPNLDDRTYDDLVQEALSLIPTDAPEWTNHNPSDPGITLIELFAYLTEMLLYRQNRITDANRWRFVQLLNGVDWTQQQAERYGVNWHQELDLEAELRQAVMGTRDRHRAVTCADFEALAQAADPQVARAHCIPQRNLVTENRQQRDQIQAGHISVIIVPAQGTANPQPNSTLIQAVQDYLAPRRLLTTRIHVVGPRYVSVGIRLTLVLKRDAIEPTAQAAAIQALEQFLSPLVPGGPDQAGWPFGRNVYVSEIYALLDDLDSIDYVQQTDGQDELTVDDPSRLIQHPTAQLIGINLEPDELVHPAIDPNQITLISPIQSAEA